MAVIQFKRVLNYYPEGFGIDEAVEKITAELSLRDGEPLLCSYNDNGALKYLLAIGVSGSIKVYPMFESVEDIKNFIKNNSTTINIIDNVSDDSDLTIEQNAEGLLVYKLKDNIKNN